MKVCPVVEDEMDEEIVADKEEQSEKCRAVRQKKDGDADVGRTEEHDRTHILYRNWCRHCVAARVINPAHRGRRFTKANMTKR